MIQKKNKTRAFTLVEILIGISVIAVTMTAMASLVIVSMRANVANVNSLQAYYLAEEGIEAMRNIRDTNWRQNYGWSSSFECNMDGDTYYFTVDDRELTETMNYQLYEAEEVGYLRFTHDSSYEESIFSRYIMVEYEECDFEAAKVSSVVTWNERGNEREVVLTTYLTDWQS